MSAAQTAQVLNNQQVSFAFWYRTNNTTTSSMIFGNDSMGDNNNRKFSIFNYPTVNDLHLSWMNDAASVVFFGCVIEGFFPTSEWVHCAIVYDNPSVKIYKNGELVFTGSGASNSSTFNYATQIIWNNSTGSRNMNDFRIYNHALSEKEVKEISKALILHYPLNNIYETNTTNLYSGEYVKGSPSWKDAPYTVTKNADGVSYNYNFSYTGTGGDAWPAIEFPRFNFTAGKTYMWKIKVRVNSCTSNYSLTARQARIANDQERSFATCVSTSKIGTGWQEYSVLQTLEATSTRNGTSYTTDPLLEFYPGSLKNSGEVYAANFDIKDVCIVETDQIVPFVRNDLKSNIVEDCSGFNNNGTLVNTVTCMGESPRYSCSSRFNSSGIITPINLTLEKFTISFWGKHTETNKMLLGSLSTSLTWNDEWYWYGDNSFKYPQGEFYYEHNAGPVVLNTWIHFVAVYDGTQISIYRNGIYEGSKEVSNALTWTNLSVGCGLSDTYMPQGGQVSDFRLYTTALSAEDIKELYEVSQSVDKDGNVYAYQFIEE